MTALLVLLAGALVAARWRPRPLRGFGAPATPPARGDLSADTLAFLHTAARELRTGSSHGVAVEQALRAAGASEPLLRGRLGGAAGDVPSHRHEVAVAVQAVHRSAGLGHHPAAVFDRAAASLREQQALRAEQQAHTAQARLSARVLTVVPVAFAAFSAWSSSDVRRVLWSPAGAALVTVGLAVNLLGWWWMRRIVRRAS